MTDLFQFDEGPVTSSLRPPGLVIQVIDGSAHSCLLRPARADKMLTPAAAAAAKRTQPVTCVADRRGTVIHWLASVPVMSK